MVRSTLSLTWRHGESFDAVLTAVSGGGLEILRVAGVGVVGGGDLSRSESDLWLLLRSDLTPRSGEPTSVMGRPCLCSGESSGLLSLIAVNALGVRWCLDPGVDSVVDFSDFFSFGSPKIDWYGTFCLVSFRLLSFVGEP